MESKILKNLFTSVQLNDPIFDKPISELKNFYGSPVDNTDDIPRDLTIRNAIIMYENIYENNVAALFTILEAEQSNLYDIAMSNDIKPCSTYEFNFIKAMFDRLFYVNHYAYTGMTRYQLLYDIIDSICLVISAKGFKKYNSKSFFSVCKTAKAIIDSMHDVDSQEIDKMKQIIENVDTDDSSYLNDKDNYLDEKLNYAPIMRFVQCMMDDSLTATTIALDILNNKAARIFNNQMNRPNLDGTYIYTDCCNKTVFEFDSNFKIIFSKVKEYRIGEFFNFKVFKMIAQEFSMTYHDPDAVCLWDDKLHNKYTRKQSTIDARVRMMFMRQGGKLLDIE